MSSKFLDTPEGQAGIWIRADTNRDGKIDSSDELGKSEWTAQRGAIFLANLDDDESRCSSTAPDGCELSDSELARCNDASDDVVNGDRDIDDLAKIHVCVPGDVHAAIVTPDPASRDRVRLFVASGAGAKADDWKVLPPTGSLPVAVATGSIILLGIEAKDIVRDSSWTGLCRLSLSVELADGRIVRDCVVLKVAPLVFVSDPCPLETLYASGNDSSVFPGEDPFPLPVSDARVRAVRDRIARTQAPFRRDLIAGLNAAGLGSDALKLLPSLDFRRADRGVAERLQAISERVEGSVGTSGITIWPQDWMQPAFMSMPSRNGQHLIRVWVRSSSRNPCGDPTFDPLRRAGRIVFAHLRGPECAGVQHYDPDYVPADNRGDAGVYGAFDMGGNYNVVPPHKHNGHYYPHGRLIYGSAPGHTADPAFNAMIAAQGYQKPIVVDTSWLEVGHVDSIVSFVPANTDRGWAMLVADPELGLKLLRAQAESGRWDDPLFSGHEPWGARFPAITIGEVIQKDTVVRGTTRAREAIENTIRILFDEVGLDEGDVIFLPVLFGIPDQCLPGEPIAALLPDAVNLVNTGTPLVFASRQHAPIVDGGDIFERITEERLGAIGVTVHWIEDFEYANLGGDVHCATNAVRDVSALDPWWGEGPIGEG